jgi:oligosaccharide translocase
MSESKVRKVIRSSFAGVANYVILFFLNLLSRNLFLQYIGLDYLSMAQVINNLLTIVAFSELGLSNAVLYMLYRPVAERDEAKIVRLLYLYRQFNRYVGGAIAVLGMLFMPLLSFFIRTDIPDSTVYLVYIMNLVAVVSTYFYNYRVVLLSANQKDYVASLISTGISFLRVGIQCGVIYWTHDYILFLATGLFAGIVQNATIYFQTGRLYSFIRSFEHVHQSNEIKTERRELRKNIFSMSSVKIASIVIDNTDTILLSWINTLLVGLCANYMMISNGLKSVVMIVQQAFLHSVGISLAEKEPEQKFELFRQMLTLNTYLTGLLIVGLFVSWNAFIVLWIGEQYVIEFLLFFALLLNLGWNFMISPIWIFRDASGMFVYVRKMLLVNASLNVILSLFLGWQLGGAGIFFGTVLADFSTDFWYDSNILYKKVFGQKNGHVYQRHILENMFSSMMIGAVLYYIMQSWGHTMLDWLIRSCIACVVYTLWFYLRYRRTEAFQSLCERFRIAK